MPATEELEEATATWELDEAGEKAWGGALPHPPHPKPTAAVATRRVAACRCRVDRERAVARLKGAPPHPLEFLSPTQPPVAAGVAPTLGRPPPARANARARAGHSEPLRGSGLCRGVTELLLRRILHGDSGTNLSNLAGLQLNQGNKWCNFLVPKKLTAQKETHTLVHMDHFHYNSIKLGTQKGANETFSTLKECPTRFG
uniref:Uncharacterized protein n=1 Tax=Oryza sativa subsp. japonica TaxID=39947 RepID=Q69P48_ORYSJ|nr:hypothetical protein [Oryza sativa Japonica Group]BAD33648.1 hypothetical protein [Oryza sativa Japonica Group]